MIVSFKKHRTLSPDEKAQLAADVSRQVLEKGIRRVSKAILKAGRKR